MVPHPSPNRVYGDRVTNKPNYFKVDKVRDPKGITYAITNQHGNGVGLIFTGPDSKFRVRIKNMDYLFVGPIYPSLSLAIQALASGSGLMVYSDHRPSAFEPKKFEEPTK